MAVYVFDDVEVVCVPVQYSQVKANNCYFTVYEGGGRNVVDFGVTDQFFEGHGWSGRVVYRGTNLPEDGNSFVSLPNAVDPANISVTSFLDDPFFAFQNALILEVLSVDGVRV